MLFYIFNEFIGRFLRNANWYEMCKIIFNSSSYNRILPEMLKAATHIQKKNKTVRYIHCKSKQSVKFYSDFCSRNIFINASRKLVQKYFWPVIEWTVFYTFLMRAGLTSYKPSTNYSLDSCKGCELLWEEIIV